MNDNQKSLMFAAWRALDLVALENLSAELACNDPASAMVVNALTARLKGNLSSAAALFESVNTSELDPLMQSFVAIEVGYMDMKLKRSSQRRSVYTSLLAFAKLWRLGSGTAAVTLRHHYLYTWFIRAFWYDHRESLISGSLLWICGVLGANAEARVHGRFLVGHVLNVKGFPTPGVPLVVSALRGRVAIQPWLRACFFSYMSYGLFMVGREEKLTPLIFQEADHALAANPDPFYRILYWVCSLRAFSQAGDVVRAEAIAPLLIEMSEKTGSKRFLYSSKADLALCYGIRGMLWKCDEILRELEEFDETSIDPVEIASLLRLRGWAYFFVGRYEDAINDARRSRAAFGKTRSFFNATEIVEILILVASLRLKMMKIDGLDEAVKAARDHRRELSRLKRRYRSNETLLAMVREEESSFLQSFHRLFQPGYSRISSVVACQQSLQGQLHEIIDVTSDEEAWRLLSGTIENALGCSFTHLIKMSGTPSFRARRSVGTIATIEVAVPRAGDAFDVANFACADKYQVSVALDAFYSLQPTLVSLLKTRDLQAQILAGARHLAAAELARQVAHDIRSPLSALNMVAAMLSSEAEDKRSLIRNAVKRINDIANSLLSKGRSQQLTGRQPSAIVAHQIGYLVDTIISEKRLQFLNRTELRIDFDPKIVALNAFAKVDEASFKRVISNLVNNSVEALEGRSGRINVSVARDDDRVVVTVEDDGKGIPSEVLPKLTTKGFSFDKPNGSGLGLNHAKTSTEAWSGRFTIDSNIGRGTKAVIELPASPPPNWFAWEIEVVEGARVVALDDDASVLEIWQHRLCSIEGASQPIEYKSFLKAKELVDFVAELDPARRASTRFLIDYELAQQSANGLDVISQLNLGSRAILVTSRYEDADLQARAVGLGVKVMPKSLAPFAPIRVRRKKAGPFETLAGATV